MTLEMERCQTSWNCTGSWSWWRRDCYFNKANSAYASHPVEMGLKTKRPTKMHLEALEINRQGERFSGLEDQKTFFFLTQSNYAFITLSPGIKGSMLWKLDTRCGGCCYYYLPYKPGSTFKFPLNTATELSRTRLKRGCCFPLSTFLFSFFSRFQINSPR